MPNSVSDISSISAKDEEYPGPSSSGPQTRRTIPTTGIDTRFNPSQVEMNVMTEEH